jgi:hypothetical protein
LLRDSGQIEKLGKLIAHFVRFELSMALIMKNAAFWDVALVRTNVMQEYIFSIIRVERISELGMLAVTSN